MRPRSSIARFLTRSPRARDCEPWPHDRLIAVVRREQRFWRRPLVRNDRSAFSDADNSGVAISSGALAVQRAPAKISLTMKSGERPGDQNGPARNKNRIASLRHRRTQLSRAHAGQAAHLRLRSAARRAKEHRAAGAASGSDFRWAL